MLTDRPRTYGWTPRKDALLVQLVGAGYSWTADQIDELRDMYGRGFTAFQIAKAMGRTLKSVYGQAYRLGLSREQAEDRRRKR